MVSHRRAAAPACTVAAGKVSHASLAIAVLVVAHCLPVPATAGSGSASGPVACIADEFVARIGNREPAASDCSVLGSLDLSACNEADTAEVQSDFAVLCDDGSGSGAETESPTASTAPLNAFYQVDPFGAFKVEAKLLIRAWFYKVLNEKQADGIAHSSGESTILFHWFYHTSISS